MCILLPVSHAVIRDNVLYHCDLGSSVTDPIQEDADLASSIYGSLLATQLADFAQDAHGLVGKVFEMWSCDARGRFRHGFV